MSSAANGGLDLTEFDPMPAKFDLMIEKTLSRLRPVKKKFAVLTCRHRQALVVNDDCVVIV